MSSYHKLCNIPVFPLPCSWINTGPLLFSPLKQPVGWLYGYHPNIGYLFHFNYVHWINRGPRVFPLWGIQWTAGLERGMKIIPLWEVYYHILSRFVLTTFMFLLRWYLHILLVKKTPILSLMLTISFTVTKFPQTFLGLSRICLLNAMSLSHYFFLAEVRAQISAPWLRPKKEKLPISCVL